MSVFFGFVSYIRVENFRRNSTLFFRVAVDIEEHRQDAGCVIPLVFSPGIRHDQEFAERKGIGIQPEDSG
jgi:hypothetical protein